MSEWKIPSEEMPPEGIVVLVTVSDGDHEAVQMAYQIGGEWLDIVSNETVVAWMPLPPPMVRRKKYCLQVFDVNGLIEIYETNKLKDLMKYYEEHWKWHEADSDCYCHLITMSHQVRGRELKEVKRRVDQMSAMRKDG